MLHWLIVAFLFLSAILTVEGHSDAERKGEPCHLIEKTMSYATYNCSSSVQKCFLRAAYSWAPRGVLYLTPGFETSCSQIAGRVPEVPQQELDAFIPFAVFAAASYCHPRYISLGLCSPICKRRPKFNATHIAGNGGGDPTYFVGYSPEDDAVVVSRQGTDPRQWESMRHNFDFRRRTLDIALFPDSSDDESVHTGFEALHSVTAEPIRMEVEKLLTVHKTKKLFVTGHSRGGAVAMLDALRVQMQTVTFGMPRVGNAAFVEYFDSRVRNFTRIVNGVDIVVDLPPRLIGYLHAKGEVRILANGTAVRCPGNDFEGDARCYAGDNMSPSSNHFLDHFGPYPGDIYMQAGIYGEPAAQSDCPAQH